MSRKLVGDVTSDVQNKTITVAISRSVTHPIYGKRYSVTKKFAVHDEKNEAHKGDRVEIVETRPISKNKTWKLSKVIETGHAQVEVKGEELIADVEAQRRALRQAQGEEAKAEDAEVETPVVVEAKKPAVAKKPAAKKAIKEETLPQGQGK